MTTLRTAAQQALEALEYHVEQTRPIWKTSEAIAALEAALAEPTIQTCNCRWDGETQVQQCTLHEAHVDAIHEWAERAKTAEKKLAALAEPVQDERTTIADLRCAKWLDPECADKGACQSLKFKRSAEPVQVPVGAVLVNRESREGVMFYSVDMIPDPSTLKDRFELVPVYTAPPQRPAEPVQEQPVCDECGKHKRDGWALYCVDCVEPVFALSQPPDSKHAKEKA